MGIRFLFTVLFLFSSSTFAYNETESAAAAPSYYFTVKEITVFSAKSNLETLNLLDWKRTNSPLPVPRKRYNRAEHFGKWVDDPTDDNCYNTRAKILMRDSEDEVEFSERNPCLVEYGTWNDPYTGETFHSAKDIQIDHMVPLKNAYISGGYAWSQQKRCLYANFTGYKSHLKSVNGDENMLKSDNTPEQYMPKAQEFRCTYLKEWLYVKALWQLKMTPAESKAIQKQADENDCDTEEFKISVKEFKKIRHEMVSSHGYCNFDTSANSAEGNTAH